MIAIIELTQKVTDAFIVECEHHYQYRALEELDYDVIFSDTIDSMIADGVEDALNNDNIVSQIYHQVLNSRALQIFIDDKAEEEKETAAFARDPYSYFGMSWNDFI